MDINTPGDHTGIENWDSPFWDNPLEMTPDLFKSLAPHRIYEMYLDHYQSIPGPETSVREWASAWRVDFLPPMEALEWHCAGFTRNESRRWRTNQFFPASTPMIAKNMIENGITLLFVGRTESYARGRPLVRKDGFGPSFIQLKEFFDSLGVNHDRYVLQVILGIALKQKDFVRWPDVDRCTELLHEIGSFESNHNVSMRLFHRIISQSMDLASKNQLEAEDSIGKVQKLISIAEPVNRMEYAEMVVAPNNMARVGEILEAVESGAPYEWVRAHFEMDR